MIEKGETAREILATSVTKSTSVGAIDRDPLQFTALAIRDRPRSGIWAVLRRVVMVSLINTGYRALLLSSRPTITLPRVFNGPQTVRPDSVSVRQRTAFLQFLLRMAQAHIRQAMTST